MARAKRRRAVKPKPKPKPKAAFSVRYYEITDWPEIDRDGELLAPRWIQSSINPNEGGPAHTRFRPAMLWRVRDVQKLDVEHERSRHSYRSPFYTQNWRLREEVVNALIERYTFTAYLPADRRGIYMRANATVAYGALRRLRESLATFSFKQRNVDVLKFIECLKTPVAKAWWKEMRLEHVQSASLAGVAVDQSEDYARFNEEGQMAAATLDIRWENHLYKVMVTSLNTIFFFLADEERAIALADYVNELLRRCPGVLSTSDIPMLHGDDQDDSSGSEPDVSSGYDQAELPPR